MKTEFYCSHCKQHKTHQSDISTGYARKRNGHKVCFECCGVIDRRDLLAGANNVGLYYTNNKNASFISNWPGSLQVKAYHYTTTNNWGYPVKHIYFQIDNKKYYARLTGDSKECLDFYRKVKG